MTIVDLENIPAELIQRADDLLDWCWEETPIAGQSRPLAVAADPDAMLIDACQRQDAGEENVIDPFWAATWRAAAGLDRFMDSISLKGRSVLELGCGTGHAGIAAVHAAGPVLAGVFTIAERAVVATPTVGIGPGVGGHGCVAGLAGVGRIG